MRCGSSAARGISARHGFGKTRHVDVRLLRFDSAQCLDKRELEEHISRNLWANLTQIGNCWKLTLPKAGKHLKIKSTESIMSLSVLQTISGVSG